MAYWLLKTEPETFSWDDQIKRGAKGEPWTGVRNFTARKHLKEMKKGDLAFFYHSGDEQADRRHRRGDPRSLSGRDRSEKASSSLRCESASERCPSR